MWVRIALSAVSFSLIIVLQVLIDDALFNWSVGAIYSIEEQYGDPLKNFCLFCSRFGGQAPNILVICIFTAMFKRRHQAFSYLILWMVQIFVESFFKLVMHSARPSQVMKRSYDDDGSVIIPWTPPDQIISLGTPSGAACVSMAISLSIVIEYINHSEEELQHGDIRLSYHASSRTESVN